MGESLVPKHIAIVMDGNGRWATKRFLPRFAGHRQGVGALRRCVDACVKRGVAVLTVFAFSSENWKRPADEVGALFELMVRALSREVPRLHENGVRLYFVGDRTALSPRVAQGFHDAEAQTSSNRELTLNICFNYGGRWDIVQAARAVAGRGEILSEENLGRALSLAHVCDPDLLIRTGGEQRISNFLLWQCAYSELFFSKRLWPDFDLAALDEAIASYSQRERRFGAAPPPIESPADESAPGASRAS